MPEPRVREAEAAPPGPAPAGPDPRLVALKWIVRAAALAALAGMTFNIGLYAQTGVWQSLFTIGGLALALAGTALVVRLARRDRIDAAGCLSLLVGAVPFLTVALAQSGITLVLAVAGVVTLVSVGRMLLPRRWPLGVLAAALFAAAMWAIDTFEPLRPRFEMGHQGSASALAGGLTFTFIAAIVVAWLLYTYRNIISIRARLIIGFVAVTLLPALVVTGLLMGIGSQTGRRQALARLDSAARFKEAEINSWLAGLQSKLDFALSSGQTEAGAYLLLQMNEPPEQVISTLRSHLQAVIGREPLFDELLFLTRGGRTVTSSTPSEEGRDHSGDEFFRRGLAGYYLEPPAFSPALGRVSMIVARPVIDPTGATVGVLAGRIDPAALRAFAGRLSWLDDTGEIYLLDANRVLISDLRFDARRDVVLDSADAVAAIQARQTGSGSFLDYRSRPVFAAYRWLPGLQLALVAKQDRAEALRATNSMFRIVGLGTIAALIAALSGSLLLTRHIVGPLARLREAATALAAGDLELTAEVIREDEIGAVARALNTMTARLRGLVGGLEQLVAERTREMERRSALLQASAEVGQAATTVLDPDELIRAIVDAIREQFRLHYAGLFLLDNTREWAVLEAGAGTAGSEMVPRGYRIKVGEGLIGTSIADARPLVAPEAGDGTTPRGIPHLPGARSQAALPLRSRGQVLGALALHDARPAAFDDATMAVLQTMADQVAVALDNAHLYLASQKALEAERRAYGDITVDAWAQLMRARPGWSYVCDDKGVSPCSGPRLPEIEHALHHERIILNANGEGPSAAVPIRIRDAMVGVLSFRKAGGDPWAREEIALLENLAEQLGLALESARLYADSQRHAAHEQAVRRVTEQMRRAMEIDSILQTTVAEVGKALGVPRVYVRLGTEAELSGAAGASRGDRRNE